MTIQNIIFKKLFGHNNPIIIIDDFYDNPDEIRNHALSIKYSEYVIGWFCSAMDILNNAIVSQNARLINNDIKEIFSKITITYINKK